MSLIGSRDFKAKAKRSGKFDYLKPYSSIQMNLHALYLESDTAQSDTHISVTHTIWQPCQTTCLVHFATNNCNIHQLIYLQFGI